MANIRFENITKKYKDSSIIPKLNLEINSGEFVVLVGPSGCGKSTTLRMVAGLESISTGQLWIDNNLANDSYSNLSSSQQASTLGSMHHSHLFSFVNHLL